MLLRRMATRSGGPSFVADRPRALPSYLVGIPFLLAAATPCLAFRPEAALAGLVLGVLAFFTVQLPVAAALLASPSADSAEFPLSGRVYLALLTVWTLTVWLASAANS